MLTFSRDTGAFEPALKALAAQPERYFGDPRASVVQVGRIDRPFSSVARLRIETLAGRSYAFLKVLKVRRPGPEEYKELRELLQNEYAATERLYEALRSRPGLVPLRPIAIFPDLLAVVTAEVAGERFDRVVRRAWWGIESPGVALESARRVGAWVRAYQDATPARGKVSAGREYVDVRLRMLARMLFGELDREIALAAYDALSTRIDSPQPMVAIHADLCPANILVRPPGDVTVLDFTTAKTGSRFHDIAHLFLHLEFQRRRTPFRQELSRGLQRALLEGYGDGVSPTDPEFQLMLLQHIACHVALLVQREPPIAPGAYRLFLRRRWRQYTSLWRADS